MGDWYMDDRGEWAYDVNAPSPPRDPAMVQLQATVSRETPRGGDVGDWIDPNAPDPTGAEVTDPEDPSYVHPWFGG